MFITTLQQVNLEINQFIFKIFVNTYIKKNFRLAHSRNHFRQDSAHFLKSILWVSRLTFNEWQSSAFDIKTWNE